MEPPICPEVLARQGRRIDHIIRGQICADNFTADKIEAKVKLAPSSALGLCFVLAFQPLALTKYLQSRAVDPQMDLA